VAVVLSDPSPELAERLLGAVGPDKRLVGMKMSAMGGSNPVPINTFAAAAGFLRVPRYEDAIRSGSQEMIGYIDPAALAKWLRGVFGDHELADAVQAEIDTGEAFGLIAPRIKELLQARVVQIAPEPDAPDAGDDQEGDDT
jgi:hypothetical protein